MNGDVKKSEGRSALLQIPPFFGGAAWAFLLLGGLRAIRSLMGSAGADPARETVLAGLLAGIAVGGLAGDAGFLRRGRSLRAAVRLVPAGIALLLPLLPRASAAIPAEVFAPILSALAGLCLGAAAADLIADPERGRTGLAVSLAGASAASFLGGWILFPSAGLGGIVLFSFALFLIAGGALILPGPGSAGVEAVGDEEREERGFASTLALLPVGAAAAMAMIAWVRIGDLVLGSTERNLALLIAVILLGSGVGIVSSVFSSRMRIDFWTGGCAVLFASFLMFVLFLVPHMPFWYARSIGGGFLSPGGVFSIAALLAALIVLPGAIPLGAAGGALLFRHRRVASSSGIGRRGVALTAGAALGAFVGPRLLPSIGVRGMVSGAGMVLLLLAALLLLFSRRRPLSMRLLGIVPLVLLLLFVLFNPPRWKPALASAGMFRLASLQKGNDWDAYRLEHNQLPSLYGDGSSASVMVVGAPGSRVVRRDGWIDGSDGGLKSIDILLARLPFLFRPDAESALVLGAGTGVTSGMLFRAGAERVLLVDPEPFAFRAIRHFGRINGEPWKEEGFQTRAADPRRHLLHGEPVDVIVCADAPVADRKRAHLRTEEFFRLAASRLKEGGVAVCPLPLSGLREDHLRSLLLSFRASFPEVLGFRAGDQQRLILLGSDRPLTLRASEALERWEENALRADFGEARIRDLEGLAAAVRLDGETIDRYADGAVPNRDAGGFVEYGAEWWLRDLEGGSMDAILRGRGYDVERFLDFEGLPPAAAAELHLRIARAFRRDGYGPGGLRHAEKSWRLGETPVAAGMYAFFLRTEENDLDSAIAVTRSGLALDPGNAPLIRQLADDLFSSHRFEECEAFLTGIIRGGFRQAWIYLIRGKARLAQGRHEAGLEDMLEAKEIDRLQDQTGTINFFIGMALKNLGRLEESQNYLERTIRKNSRHRMARYEYGENKMLMGEIDREEFEREYLIPNNRARAESLFVKSEKDFYEPRHAEEVEKGLITVLNSTPNHFGAYFRLAEYYARRGETEREKRVIERALVQFARRPEILALTEEYLRRTGGGEKVRAYGDLLRGEGSGAAEDP
ncbi:MAG: hypothetical protein JW958_00800 [Candidatus Eisenbacteria bacterium]|nr:hypothetical protein [Candidatus Eisenbacteria bacterium]